VHRSLQLAPGERVLISYDAAQDPALTEAIRSAVIRAGGIIVAEWTWPSEEVGKYLDSLDEAERHKRAAAEDAIYRELFARADVYLWLHVSGYKDLVPKRFEKLIADSKVRAIHSHWFPPPDAADHDAVWRMYERAIAVDSRALEATEAALEAKLRGSTVRLKSPGGTNLTFRIPADAWFHHNTGDASRAKVASARSTRDREEELPAGVLRTTYVREASGVLVATFTGSAKAGSVRLTFRDGRITDVKSLGGYGDDFVKWYADVKGDRDGVGELVIGTNAELQPILPSGFMPYYGYGAGIIRIAIGDNWESGGSLRTEGHEEEWLFVTDGTLAVNGATVIENGNIVAVPAPQASKK